MAHHPLPGGSGSGSGRASVRASSVIWATIAVAGLSLLGEIYHVRVSQVLGDWLHSKVLFIYLLYLIPLSCAALAGSYWLGWIRLPGQRVSRVIVEAIVFSVAFLLAARIVSDFVYAHTVDTSSYLAGHPLAWLDYIKSDRRAIGLILVLAAVSGSIGALLPTLCVQGPAVQRAKTNTGAWAIAGVSACLVLYVITTVVVEKWAYGSFFYGSSIKINAFVAVAPVALAVAASVIGSRRVMAA